MLDGGYGLRSLVATNSTAVQHTPTSSTANFTNRIRRMAISPSYARLESGMGPSRTGKGSMSRFTWKKLAIGAAVFIVFIWLFGPRKPQHSPSISEETTTAVGTTHSTTRYFPPPAATTTATHDRPKPPLETPSTRPTSFETDPDPSKTVYCTTPFSPSHPLVQYALMIDAGSTGSRIHVYKFNNCGSSPQYEYEYFQKVHPGLSSYAGRPMDAAKSLDELLDEAVRLVPTSLHKCTPVAVKATAGLRLLGAAQSAAILEAVEDRLLEEYPFRVHSSPGSEGGPSGGGVVIMDGKDEGVYAWLTANYMLNTVRSDTPPGTSTYAVLDLGGASTQIVFEPTFTQPDETLVEGEHKYDLSFGGKTYVLYQHSYLGYGLMEGRKSVHRLVDFMASLRKNPGGAEEIVGNPCLAKGTKRVVEIDDERTGKRNVTMGGEDIGNFEACNRVIELVLAKDAICHVKPCSFDGVYQPSLIDTFPTGKVLLLSYFYDRLHPLLAKTDPPPLITTSTFGSLAQDVCEGEVMWGKRWGIDEELMMELQGRPEWCLDLTFMHGLLKLGYELGERELAIGKQIEGTELGWSLGATLAMVAEKEIVIMLFCPTCANLLVISTETGRNKWACNTCAYEFPITKQMTSRTKLKRKEVDDVLGGEEMWKHADATAASCEKCNNNLANFYQLQIRSADEPMTTFYRCTACGHPWREN